MKKTIILLLIISLGFILLAGCGGDNAPPDTPDNTPSVAQSEEPDDTPDNTQQTETSAPESTPAPTPEPEDDVDRAEWKGFIVSLVDEWYVDDDGYQFIELRQNTDAFDVPDLFVRYVGGASHMSPAWYIDEKSSEEWVEEYGEIKWAENLTINGIEYLMAEFAGQSYKVFWLFAMPGTPDKDFDTTDSAFLVMEVKWIDIAGIKPLLETVEIDWSAAPLD